MPRKPSRTDMCTWLSIRLGEIRCATLFPDDPAQRETATAADQKLWRLRVIAAEMGSHKHADLQNARALMAAYDTEYPARQPAYS